MDNAMTGMQSLSLQGGSSANRATPSTLMDKVPPEIRVKIFEHVLSKDRDLIRVDSVPIRLKKKYDGTRMDVSLFTVSRTISEEAQEAFCAVNTFRLRTLDIPFPLPERVKHVEFARKAAYELCHHLNHKKRTLNTVDVVGVFRSALTSISVPCEELPMDGKQTVRGFLAGQNPKANLKCIEIGTFEMLRAPSGQVPPLDGEERILQVKVQFDKPGLREVLPLAKEYATKHRISELFDMQRDYEKGIEHFTYDLDLEIAATQAARWLQFFEVVRAMHHGDTEALTRCLTEEEQEYVPGFQLDGFDELPTVPWDTALLPRDVKLMDLIGNADKYDSELLEWATEFMALNLPTGRGRDRD